MVMFASFSLLLLLTVLQPWINARTAPANKKTIREDPICFYLEIIRVNTAIMKLMKLQLKLILSMCAI
jgi:hypothetical protein